MKNVFGDNPDSWLQEHCIHSQFDALADAHVCQSCSLQAVPTFAAVPPNAVHGCTIVLRVCARLYPRSGYRSTLTKVIHRHEIDLQLE